MSRAQIETAIQLGSANAELVMGEQTLQSKTAELETAKEAAYQKADVNQMLTVDMVKTLLSAQNFHMPVSYTHLGIVAKLSDQNEIKDEKYVYKNRVFDAKLQYQKALQEIKDRRHAAYSFKYHLIDMLLSLIHI